MFSGTLTEVGGILWLLEAFATIPDPNLALWITGRGDLVSRVEQAARDDRRIRYLGFVDREQLLELYGQASILANPRPSWLPEHRYNFPSKLIQYMATGRPVITTETGDVGEYEPFVYLLREEHRGGPRRAHRRRSGPAGGRARGAWPRRPRVRAGVQDLGCGSRAHVRIPGRPRMAAGMTARAICLWQNLLSPHQSAHVRALGELAGVPVTLFAEAGLPDWRRRLGWSEPDFGPVRVVVAPEAGQIADVFAQADPGDVHLFSGMRAYPMVWRAFRFALAAPVRVGLISEPGDWRGARGVARWAAPGSIGCAMGAAST